MDAGALKDTVAFPLPAVATTPVGAPGAVTTACGVTPADAAEGTLVPPLLVAVTVKV